MKSGIGAGLAVEDDALLHDGRHLQPEGSGERVARSRPPGAGKLAASSPVKRRAWPNLPGTSAFAGDVDPGALSPARLASWLFASSRSSG